MVDLQKCFSSFYLILNLNYAAKVRKLSLIPTPYLFQKTLYLCKSTIRYRNFERYYYL